MSTPIDALIDRLDMRCTICNAPRSKGCSCWEDCSCGWLTRTGEPCDNPKTRACSTKVKYGKYNRRTKRYE